ncbi:hypothetical protein GWK47_002300 [Chionoecetes opilio]|uniref:Uncharacterized protein n=1 Tax=Chionoecetes opilio TaxID=41210 RepID=A0A8J4XPZ9_CHIOP|nr:hypothetical protein GWK47_002300 [Chionoecetes opilio]
MHVPPPFSSSSAGEGAAAHPATRHTPELETRKGQAGPVAQPPTTPHGATQQQPRADGGIRSVALGTAPGRSAEDFWGQECDHCEKHTRALVHFFLLSAPPPPPRPGPGPPPPSCRGGG